MKRALKTFVLCAALAGCAQALEVAGTAPASVKGASKADFNLSGLIVKNIAYDKGAVIMPVTESKGRTYSDVKLLSKNLYVKIEDCFKNGCGAAAKTPMPAIKAGEFKPLKSKIRVANAEVVFDGELLVSLGVMVSSREPGTFWLAWPDTLEFENKSLKAAAEKTVQAAWAKNKK